MQENSKKLESAGDQATCEKVKLRTENNKLQNQVKELQEENGQFKEQLEVANNILGEANLNRTGDSNASFSQNPLEDLDALAPVAARTAAMIKGKTLTEIVTELNNQIQKNDDFSQINESLELNLDELTKKVSKFKPYAKDLQKDIARLENQNAELVSQLDLSHRDQMSYRTQADDLLIENQKLKRVVARREKETCDLRGAIFWRFWLLQNGLFSSIFRPFLGLK